MSLSTVYCVIDYDPSESVLNHYFRTLAEAKRYLAEVEDGKLCRYKITRPITSSMLIAILNGIGFVEESIIMATVVDGKTTWHKERKESKKSKEEGEEVGYAVNEG